MGYMDKGVIKQPFWSMSVEETLQILEVTKEGLFDEEAEKRLKIFGANEIQDGERFSKFRLLLKQFKSPLILILIVAGVVTVFLKDWLDMGVIFAAVIVNTTLGFYQENKAENILELLKTYVRTRTRVKRDGQETIFDASKLVPGDIIRITQGDKIPADGRIIFANNFEVDESILTGESTPVDKKIDSVSAGASVGDRFSMVFGSTLAVSGFADVVVTATAMNTEFGRITALLEKREEPKTPIQTAILNFSFWVGLILLVLTVTLFIFGLYLNYDPLVMFLIAVAIAVSVVPESLPIALTVIMAIGVEQLAKRKGVVRKLLAAETLGSTNLILTDKTGTLTEGKMELTAVIPYKNSSPEKMVELLSEALTTVDVVIENPNENPDKWQMFGNLMEVALVRGSAKRKVFLNDVFEKNQVYDRLTFSSDRKYAASVHAHNGSRRMMLLGAPENLLNFTNLNFDGLVTFRDPLRKGVFESMQGIKEAGVRTIIVTGDHQGTAEAVARELGLVDGKGAVLTGNA